MKLKASRSGSNGIEVAAAQWGDRAPDAARIPLLPESQWTDDVREMFTIFEGEAARTRGSQYNIMKTLAHHPTLMTRFLRFEHQLLRRPTIDGRIREIVVLRLARLYDQPYEWRQHVLIARDLGMSEEEIEAAGEGSDAPCWQEPERSVLLAAEDMYRGRTIDDETWAGLADHYDHAQMLELLFVIGTFAMMSWVFNCTRLEVEGRPD